MKLTEAQWQRIRAELPTALAQEIEEEVRIAGLPHGRKITCSVCRNDTERVDVIGEELTDLWAIMPRLGRDGTLHRRYCSLTHRPSGRTAWTGQSRKAVMMFWEEFRRYDVHHIDPVLVTAGAIAGGVLELNKKHREAAR